MSLLEKVLELGESFDWITPLDGLIRDLINGPHYDFVVEADDAGIAHQVIKDRRAKVWGMMFVQGVFTFTCRLAEAADLWVALERAGVVPLNDNPPARVRRPAGARPARRAGLLERLDRWAGF